MTAAEKKTPKKEENIKERVWDSQTSLQIIVRKRRHHKLIMFTRLQGLDLANDSVVRETCIGSQQIPQASLQCIYEPRV